MKLENLNLGKSLSKDEQKKIRGGENPCPSGNFIDDCRCQTIFGVLCIPSNGSTPFTTCDTYCVARYGVDAESAMDCVASCGN